MTKAAQITAAAIRFSRGVDGVWTPERLVPLREHVRTCHEGELHQVHEAINERFGTTGAHEDYVNVFHAASEMALMEWVGRSQLNDDDRQLLRQLWADLLSAT